MRQPWVGGVHLVPPDIGGSKACSPPARRRCSDGAAAGSGGDLDSLHDSWDRADGSNGHTYRGWMWASHARPAGS